MSALPTRTDISDTPSNATAKAALTAEYDFIAQRLAAGTAGAGTATEAELLLARASLGISQPVMRNFWRNSDGFINQRSTATSVADAAYGLFDRTYCLHDGGNVTLSRLNQPTDGIPYAMRIAQPDGLAKRIGFAQAVESADCLAYRGSQLVFAPKLRLSTSANLRVALLAWTGTADTITRDVVSNWASGTYTPSNFFAASNVSVIAVGSAAMTANTWADVPVSSASAGGVVAPSGMNNLIMMAWTEASVATGVTLDASCIRAGLGTQTPIWTPPDVGQELRAAMRWYEDRAANDCFNTLDVGGTSVYTFAFPFAEPKRIAPVSGNVTLTGNMTGFGAPSFNTATTQAIRINAAASGAAQARIFSTRIVTDVSL